MKSTRENFAGGISQNGYTTKKVKFKIYNVTDKRGESPEDCEWIFLQMLGKCGLALDPLCITRAHRIGVST